MIESIRSHTRSAWLRHGTWIAIRVMMGTRHLLPLFFLVRCAQPPAFVAHDDAGADVADVDAGLLLRPIDVRSVVTQHVDLGRTGANAQETLLTRVNIGKGTFGLLATRAVRGYVYGQPLFVPNLDIPGKGTHDVVYVATEHNDVYAFDADDPSPAEPLWHVWLGAPAFSEDLYSGYGDIAPEVGITSTPVIDAKTATLFVVAKTEEGSVFSNRVHALDLRNGTERAGSPRELDLGMDHKWILQRPGLAVDRGLLWIAGGGHSDYGPYHGWIALLDASTLELRGRYLTTPNGTLGGIWQAGTGLAIDEDGAAYFETGNGTFDDTTDPPNLGDSFGKVTLRAGKLELADWFTPHNQAALDLADADLGSSGPVVIPGTKLLVGGGKEGKLYVIDRRAMGHIRMSDDAQIVQSFQVTDGGELFSAPVFWSSRLYTTAAGDPIRAFRFLGDRFEEKPFMASTIIASGPSVGAIAISSNGVQPGTGILWSLMRADGSTADDGPGALRALDADDLHVLWSSLDDPADAVGSQSKFVTPTAAGGKVFVPTANGRLLVYGLK